MNVIQSSVALANPALARYHGYAYDGIWTIARAIDSVERQSKQPNTSLVHFQYK